MNKQKQLNNLLATSTANLFDISILKNLQNIGADINCVLNKKTGEMPINIVSRIFDSTLHYMNARYMESEDNNGDYKNPASSMHYYSDKKTLDLRIKYLKDFINLGVDLSLTNKNKTDMLVATLLASNNNEIIHIFEDHGLDFFNLSSNDNIFELLSKITSYQKIYNIKETLEFIVNNKNFDFKDKKCYADFLYVISENVLPIIVSYNENKCEFNNENFDRMYDFSMSLISKENRHSIADEPFFCIRKGFKNKESGYGDIYKGMSFANYVAKRVIELNDQENNKESFEYVADLIISAYNGNIEQCLKELDDIEENEKIAFAISLKGIKAQQVNSIKL